MSIRRTRAVDAVDAGSSGGRVGDLPPQAVEAVIVLRAVLVGHLHNLALAVILVFYQIQARGVAAGNVVDQVRQLAAGNAGDHGADEIVAVNRGAGTVRRAGAIDVGRDLRLRRAVGIGRRDLLVGEQVAPDW